MTMSWAPGVLSLLRIMAGFLFSAHGYQKVLGMLGGHRMPIGSLPWTAGMLEMVGGALLILGLFTRPVAFILCGEMAYAYFSMHGRKGFWPVMNGGELAVLYCFVFLYFFFAGPGPVSLDRVVRRKAV
jgi:putative oxidoreductase